MKYILTPIFRVIIVLLVWPIFFIVSLVVLIVDLFWNFKIKWWTEGSSFIDPEFWVMDNNHRFTPQEDRKLDKIYKTPLHYIIGKSMAK